MKRDRNLSDFWRQDKSTDRVAELASVLGGADSMIGVMGSGVRTSWSLNGHSTTYWYDVMQGQSHSMAVFLDYSPVAKLKPPFRGSAVDEIIGYASHEGGHCLWSDPDTRVKVALYLQNHSARRAKDAWLEAQNMGLKSPIMTEILRIDNILEDAYIDYHVAEKWEVLGEYIKISRHALAVQRPADFDKIAQMDDPPRNFIVNLWIACSLYDHEIPARMSKKVAKAINFLMSQSMSAIQTKDPAKRVGFAVECWLLLDKEFPASDELMPRTPPPPPQPKMPEPPKQEPQPQPQEGEEQGDEGEPQEGESGTPGDGKGEGEGEPKSEPDAGNDEAEAGKSEETGEADGTEANGASDSESEPEPQTDEKGEAGESDKTEAEAGDEAEADEADHEEGLGGDEDAEPTADDGDEAGDDGEQGGDEAEGEAGEAGEAEEGGSEAGGKNPSGDDSQQQGAPQTAQAPDSAPGGQEQGVEGNLDDFDIRQLGEIPEKLLEAVMDAIAHEMEDLSQSVQQVCQGRYGCIAALTQKGEYNAEAANRVHAEVQSEIAEMSRVFDRQKQQKTKRQNGLLAGRLNGRALARVGAGNLHVYSRKQTVDTPSLAVGLLLDVSGSMDSRMSVVWATACVFAEALIRKQGVNFLALTYTGGDNDVQTTRICDRALGKLCLGNVAQGGGTPSGPAIGTVKVLMDRMPEKQKVIIHFTDGSPDNSQQVIEAVANCRKAGYAVWAIVPAGYDQMAEAQYGAGNWETINSFSELPHKVGQLVEKLVSKS